MAETDLIYGIHAAQHALQQFPERVLEIWLQAESTHKGNKGKGGKLVEIQILAESLGISIQHVPRKSLDKMSNDQRHQGVVLRQRATKPKDESDLLEIVKSTDNILLLILDGVQDPHNLGACLRTADAAGASAVVIPASRGVSMTPVVRKVASGAADSVPLIEVRNLARTLKQIQNEGVWLIGTSDQANQTIYDQDLKGSIGLVMGSEDKGIRRLTSEHCDHLVQIPMAGVVESLNVSVASGVCLYEAVRQRLK